MKRLLTPIFAALAAAATLFAGGALAQGKVTFGIVTALSGPLAAPGVFQMNGFRLAEEEINAGGGITIGGRKYTVELKVYDTRGNPSEGASAMQRLATVDKVPVVLGELSSGVAAAIGPDTALVSVMHVNNETGVVQDVDAIGRLCRQRGVPLHVDAAQSVGKVPLDLSSAPIDLCSLTAHKVCGPKGVGALYVAPGVVLAPQQQGGEQEHGLRAGKIGRAHV